MAKDLNRKKIQEKNTGASVLLVWCHHSVRKTWQSNFTLNSDATPVFFLPKYPLQPPKNQTDVSTYFKYSCKIPYQLKHNTAEKQQQLAYIFINKQPCHGNLRPVYSFVSSLPCSLHSCLHCEDFDLCRMHLGQFFITLWAFQHNSPPCSVAEVSGPITVVAATFLLKRAAETPAALLCSAYMNVFITFNCIMYNYLCSLSSATMTKHMADGWFIDLFNHFRFPFFKGCFVYFELVMV